MGPESTITVESLNKCRDLAIDRQKRKNQAEANAAYGDALPWIRFLCGDAEAGMRSSYLQAYRAGDDSLYDAGSLRPIARKAWNYRNGEYEWLEKRKANLWTIAEIELALTIFDRRAKEPQFVWWLYYHPHILSRIDAFARRRYAWELIWALSEARKCRKTPTDHNWQDEKAGGKNSEMLWVPRCRFVQRGYSAGGWLSARIIGVAALGLVLLISVNVAVAILWSAHWWIVALATIVALGAAWCSCREDVFKQNAGLFAEARHARPRALALWWRLIFAGVCLSFVFSFTIWIWIGWEPDVSRLTLPDSQENPLKELTIPAAFQLVAIPTSWLSLLDVALRLLAQGAWAALFGVLLQWFWEDKSLLDPI